MKLITLNLKNNSKNDFHYIWYNMIFENHNNTFKIYLSSDSTEWPKESEIQKYINWLLNKDVY